MTQDNQRAAFAEWFKLESLPEYQRTGAWEGWQAAITHTRQQRDEWKAAVDHALTNLHVTADDFPTARDAVKALIDGYIAISNDPVFQQRGEVVVTWDESGTRILAVTRQDDEGKILSVIAEAPAPQPAKPASSGRLRPNENPPPTYDPPPAPPPPPMPGNKFRNISQPAEPVKGPSNYEILSLAPELGARPEQVDDDALCNFARALLARYGAQQNNKETR